MFLAKLYDKGSGTPICLDFENKPHSHIFLNGKLYSLINNELVSEHGYKQTYYYGQSYFESVTR
jgi:hypothetical protein